MDIKSGANDYINKLKELGRSNSTLIAYKKDFEQFTSHCQNKEVIQVETKDIEEFIDSLHAKNLTNKTISRKLNSVKSLFKFFFENGLITKDPARAVGHPEIKTKLPRYMTPKEYRSLKAVTRKSPRLFTMIELMLQTGMKIGEVSRLKITDLQLSSNPPQLIVAKAGGSPMRLVELNPAAVDALRDFIPQRPPITEGEDQGYVFNTKNGSNVIIRNIRSSINNAFKKAGIQDITVNDIRNTFITYQLEAGVSLAKIAQTVGHKRYSTTEKYLEVTSRKKEGRGDKLVEII